MSRIFISYRREDTAGYAISLHDHLAAKFGVDQIFRDFEAIKPGDEFYKVIRKKVRVCEVLLVLIGPSWLTCKEKSGKRRLDNAKDLVRLEVATALQRKIRVIPVLVGGARLPRASELCRELAPLCRRNAITLTDAAFRQDLARLVEFVGKLILPRDVAAPQTSPSIGTVPKPTRKNVAIVPPSWVSKSVDCEIKLGQPRIFRHHNKPVKTVSFSPDSRLLASAGGGSWLGGGDTAIRLWQVSDGRLLRKLEGHEQTVTMVAFSLDGKRLASVCSEAIHIWSASSGKCLRTLENSEDVGDSLAFSADGTRLVCWTKTDQEVYNVWSVSDGKHLGSYSTKRLPGKINFLWQHISPNGGMIALNEEITIEGDSYWAIMLKNIRTGALVLEIREKDGDEATEWKFSPDGMCLAIGYSNAIRLWRLPDGQLLSGAQLPKTPNSLAFSPDGRWLAAGCEDKLVRLWPMTRVQSRNY